MNQDPTTYSDWFHHMLVGLAQASIDSARQDLVALLSVFGPGTEPDFTSVTPIYNKMLAVALLLVGAVIAYGICEQVLGGRQGLHLNAVPRTVVCVAAAFCGVAVVEYVGHYAALLGTVWNPDLQATADALAANLKSGAATSVAGHPWSVLGLFVLSLFTTFLVVIVYLELVVRSALILVVTAFVPLVACMAVWPRLAGAAIGMGEFLVGLFLSKFVVATTLYIGLHLVLAPMLDRSGAASDGWMPSGVAVLLIAAFSPLVVFKAVGFSHSAAGDLTRSFGAGAASMVPMASVTKGASNFAGSGLRRLSSIRRKSPT